METLVNRDHPQYKIRKVLMDGEVHPHWRVLGHAGNGIYVVLSGRLSSQHSAMQIVEYRERQVRAGALPDLGPDVHLA